MPRGRRRKIEVPRDTQPQFELGDTTEDIERRRRETEEREGQEQMERNRERIERERMEESQERTEKQPRTDTDTDVESTQSRQKKGQMKSIFLSDSDEETMVEFVKQHEELYKKTHDKFKDKHRKEGLLAASRNLSVNTVKKWFMTQRTRDGKLAQTKSGHADGQEKSQHNTSGLSSLFGGIPSVLQYQQIDTPQPFSPSQLQPALSPVPSSTHQEQSRPPSQSSQQSQPK